MVARYRAFKSSQYQVELLVSKRTSDERPELIILDGAMRCVRSPAGQGRSPSRVLNKGRRAGPETFRACGTFFPPAVAIVLVAVRTAAVAGARPRKLSETLVGTVRAFVADMSTPRKLKALRDYCEDEELAALGTALLMLTGEVRFRPGSEPHPERM